MKDGNVFYLDGGVNYKSMCICQNSCIGMLKIYACNECKLFLQKSCAQILNPIE